MSASNLTVPTSLRARKRAYDAAAICAGVMRVP